MGRKEEEILASKKSQARLLKGLFIGVFLISILSLGFVFAVGGSEQDITNSGTAAVSDNNSTNNNIKNFSRIMD